MTPDAIAASKTLALLFGFAVALFGAVWFWIVAEKE